MTAAGLQARGLEAARKRAADGLAGRTVWCGSEHVRNGIRADAGELVVAMLDASSDEDLSRVAERIDAILTGTTGRVAPTGDDRDRWSDALLEAESRLGDAVRAGDVVVLHDALTALMAEVARERGAHVVWYGVAAHAQGDAFEEAWDMLGPCVCSIDAYAWADRAAGVAAVVPAAGAVSDGSMLGWSGVLSDIVGADRGDTVGGTVHARPQVAPR